MPTTLKFKEMKKKKKLDNQRKRESQSAHGVTREVRESGGDATTYPLLEIKKRTGRGGVPLSLKKIQTKKKKR
jgi:hypothetical protein